MICDELPAVDAAALLLRPERRLELGERLQRRLAQALVDLHQRAVGAEHGQDLPLEAALGRRPGRPLLALGAEGVHVVAGDAPLVGDQLGRDALRHEPTLVGVAGADLRAERVAELAVGHRRAHRHAGHHLDAGGDDDVVGAGDHALGGEVGGLLAGAALAVDRRAGHLLRPAGGEDGVAGDVHALLADLHHAAHHDVVDDRRIDAGAVDERLERLGGEVDRVPVLELAVALAERGADGFDDDGGGHDVSSSVCAACGAGERMCIRCSSGHAVRRILRVCCEVGSDPKPGDVASRFFGDLLPLSGSEERQKRQWRATRSRMRRNSPTSASSSAEATWACTARR